jgi:GNAT superfamily N-acetyltransferase
LSRLVQGERATALVAVRDGRLIGFCTVYLDLESVRMGQRAWLNELAVDPEHRSEGVGRQLLAQAIEWAGNQGATHVMLDSGTARVDAHRFYRRENPNLEAACFGWLI